MNYFLVSIVGVFIFLSCERSRSVYFNANVIEIGDSSLFDHQQMHELIAPYTLQLQEKMDEKLGYAACELQKNRPEGALGNFVADLVLNFAQKDFLDSGDVHLIALFNHGGLRAPINRGDILLRHVYELMPFENELVYVKLKASKFIDIRSYLTQTGGEPQAGFTFEDSIQNNDFWVVTSDYLAEGGDRMDFFLEPIQLVRTGALLRDKIIDEVRMKDTICIQLDGRWR